MTLRCWRRKKAPFNNTGTALTASPQGLEVMKMQKVLLLSLLLGEQLYASLEISGIFFLTN